MIRIALEATTMRRGRCCWKMNAALLRQNVSRNNWAALGRIVQTDQILPYYGDVVGTSGRSAHQETLHPRRDGEAKRVNTDGKLLLRLSLGHTAAPDPIRGQVGSG